MKSTNYSEKVLDHFQNPRNVGILEGEDVAVGRVGNPVCGDLMEIFIRVHEERIKEIKFRTFGCGSAIATSSMITELARGKTLDEALGISRKDVANELDGLPPIKMHCSNLAADALHAAIRNWRGEAPETESAEPNSVELHPIKGEREFAGKGFHVLVEDPAVLENKRVLIVHKGDHSIRLAIAAARHTDRVVLAHHGQQIPGPQDLLKQLRRSPVKVLPKAEVLEVTGEFEVEKARIHDLDEDEDYEIFVDAVVDLAVDQMSGPACSAR